MNGLQSHGKDVGKPRGQSAFHADTHMCIDDTHSSTQQYTNKQYQIVSMGLTKLIQYAAELV